MLTFYTKKSISVKKRVVFENNYGVVILCRSNHFPFSFTEKQTIVILQKLYKLASYNKIRICHLVLYFISI